MRAGRLVVLIASFIMNVFVGRRASADAIDKPVAQVTAPPLIEDSAERAEMERAQFSKGRLVGEIVAGTLVGVTASWAVYSATCHLGESCVGPFFLAWGAGLAVTPAAVWGTGRVVGGKGKLWHTYLLGALPVGLASLIAGSPGSSPNDSGAGQRITTGMAIANLFILPAWSAVVFELSSWGQSEQWKARHAQTVTFNVFPVPDGRGLSLRSGLTIAF